MEKRRVHFTRKVPEFATLELNVKPHTIVYRAESYELLSIIHLESLSLLNFVKFEKKLIYFF